MVLLSKGEFTLGRVARTTAMNTHPVVLDEYYIDTYEVLNAKYRNFMKTTDHPSPAYGDDSRLNLRRGCNRQIFSDTACTGNNGR